MKLSPHQPQPVSLFLRARMRETESWPPERRQEALHALRGRISREIASLEHSLDDAELGRLLDSIRLNGRKQSEPGPEAARPAVPDDSRSVWVGAFLELSRRIGVRVSVLRSGAALGTVALSLALGWVYPLLMLLPVAVAGWCYLALAFEMEILSRHRDLASRPEPWRAASLVGIALVIYVCGVGATIAVSTGYESLLSRDLVLGPWSWFVDSQHQIGVLFSLTVAPYAILSTCPMPRGWDQSMRTATQALIAVYGFAVCVGIASTVAGALLAFVESA